MHQSLVHKLVVAAMKASAHLSNDYIWLGESIGGEVQGGVHGTP